MTKPAAPKHGTDCKAANALIPGPCPAVAVAHSLGRDVCARHLAADQRSRTASAGRGARAANARRASQVRR